MKRFAYLALATSIVTISTAFATEKIEVCIPEGCKGFREHITKNDKQLQEAQEKVFTDFAQELIKFGAIQEQTKNYFYDDVLNDDQDVKKTARAFSEYFKKKFNKLAFLRDFFEGHRGVQVPNIEFEIKDKPPVAGKHYLLTQEITQIDSQIKDLQKELEEIKKVYLSVNKEEEQKQQSQENTKSEEIKIKISELQSKRADLCFQADLYALMKFIVYGNFYDSLPNDENKGPDLCMVVEPSQEEFLLQLMQQQKEKGKSLIDKVISNITSSYNDKEIYNKLQPQLNGYANSTTVQNIAQKMSEFLIQSLSQLKQPLSDMTKPYTLTSDFVNQDNRADLLLIKRANTWKDRVSTQPGSIIDQLGFLGSLYNKAFKGQTQQMMFSFAELDKNKERLQEELEKLKTRDKQQVYQMGNTQLAINFPWPDNTTVTTIKPIAEFLSRKLETMKHKKQGKYAQLIDQKDTEIAAMYALAKFASYQSMTYALTHSPDGKALPELKIVPDGYETLTKTPEAFLRLDQVFTIKAYKWGQKLKEQHQDFLEENGLTAAYF